MGQKMTNYNFIGNRKKAFILSGVLFAITIIALVLRGGLNLSIDFVGGTSLQIQFEENISDRLEQIKTTLNDLDLGTPEVRLLGSDGTGSEIQIIVKSQKANIKVGDKIRSALNQEFPETSFEIRSEEIVGPKVGKELQSDTYKAIFFSLLVIIVYIGIRFKLPYGFAAVAALFHDVIITIGLFAVTGWEFSIPVVAAVLTIIGYSLNATIVIFDRIRENMGNKKYDVSSFEDIVNRSINETLSRTIITSLTTLFVVVSIFVFFMGSGNVLENFSGALIVGIIAGTFSSLFISNSILVMWNRKQTIK